MKDLACQKYWSLFGDLGENIGRAFMPSPKEAADTVIGLMRERDALRQKVAAAEKRIAAVVANTDTLCLLVANKADEVRALAREATQDREETP